MGKHPSAQTSVQNLTSGLPEQAYIQVGYGYDIIFIRQLLSS